MDSDLMRYPGFGYRKCYMSGLDGRTIELGRPKAVTFNIDKSNDFAAKVEGRCIEPLVPDSILAELISKTTTYFEDRLVQSAYALPENYIINDRATILFWKDGTKTVVKRSKDEKFDKRLAFLTAYFQKHCGMSRTKANKFLDNLEVKE